MVAEREEGECSQVSSTAEKLHNTRAKKRSMIGCAFGDDSIEWMR